MAGRILEVLRNKKIKNMGQVSPHWGVLLQFYIPLIYKKLPIKGLYGYDGPNFKEFIFVEKKAPKTKYFLHEYQEIMRDLKENLNMDQNHQKKVLYIKRIDREFELGERVYLRLKPF